MRSDLVDLVGRSYGRLLVVSFAHNSAGARKRAYWLCRCECGNEVIVRGEGLKSGLVLSCKCLRKERSAAAAIKACRTHGMRRTQTYRSWAGMIQRCTNPKLPKFPSYGGRGISVCERWLTFRNFLDDMGASPERHSIDRIDNDGNYEPGNCRWADAVKQRANRRDSKRVGS